MCNLPQSVLQRIALDTIPQNYQFSHNSVKFQYYRIHGRKPKRDRNGQITVPRKRGQKKGVFLAAPSPTSPDKIVIGYTLCNFKAEGFDEIFALTTAFDRAVTWAEKEGSIDEKYNAPKHIVYAYNVPQSICSDLVRFIRRAQLYFKDKELPEWAKILTRRSTIAKEYKIPRKLTKAIDQELDNISENYGEEQQDTVVFGEGWRESLDGATS